MGRGGAGGGNVQGEGAMVFSSSPLLFFYWQGFSEALLRGGTILDISKASFLSSLLVVGIASSLLRFIYVRGSIV